MENKTMLGIFVIVAVAILAVGSAAAFGGFGSGAFESQEEAQAFHEGVQIAVQNGDYNSWASLMQSQITEERFAQMQDMHKQMQEVHELRDQLREAMQNGDTETVESLKAQIQELMPEGKGFGTHGRGMKGAGGFSGNCPFAE